jgi:Trypsin-co-occurring domain 2
MEGEMDDDTVDLADAIRVVRRQLDESMSEGLDSSVRFELGVVQMEFEVVLTRDTSVDGGIRFGVVSLGGKGGVSQARTHRISVEMQPVIVDDKGNRIPALVNGVENVRPR